MSRAKELIDSLSEYDESGATADALTRQHQKQQKDNTQQQEASAENQGNESE